MSEIKLLSCPFCGGEAKVFKRLGGAYVACKECAASTRLTMQEDVVKKSVVLWNTRKPMERIVERFEKIRGIQFSPLTKPLIAIEDVVKELKAGGTDD